MNDEVEIAFWDVRRLLVRLRWDNRRFDAAALPCMENRSRRMRLQFFGGSVLCVGCFRRSKDNLSFERKAWIEHECWRGGSKERGTLS